MSWSLRYSFLSADILRHNRPCIVSSVVESHHHNCGNKDPIRSKAAILNKKRGKKLECNIARAWIQIALHISTNRVQVGRVSKEKGLVEPALADGASQAGRKEEKKSNFSPFSRTNTENWISPLVVCEWRKFRLGLILTSDRWETSILRRLSKLRKLSLCFSLSQSHSLSYLATSKSVKGGR